ncbi:MAG TPA: phosphoglycerate kinase, partial [Polyangia bacterium]|nr:phosphoglycerate kinase [Polyangia bacterium]
MGIKTISELDIAGRRLFIRVDFNVPLTPEGKVSDDTRIRESLPTIKLAIEKGARVVLASHLGRPKGKPDKKYTLEPVAARLAELLDADVSLTDEPVGDGARKVVNDLHAGAVALLENLRFSPAEEANDEAFARELASYADVYVNDAFGTAHRAHASTAGITKFVAAKGMGLLMEREVKFLGKLLGDVERPFVAIIGGAKVSDKIGVLDNLLGRVDQILVGGAMANTFLRAKGGQLGRSLV